MCCTLVCSSRILKNYIAAIHPNAQKETFPLLCSRGLKFQAQKDLIALVGVEEVRKQEKKKKFLSLEHVVRLPTSKDFLSSFIALFVLGQKQFHRKRRGNLLPILSRT